MLAWRAQTQLWTISSFGLLAFTSPWVALLPMLMWSLVASVAYYHARQRGLPDLVALEKPPLDRGVRSFASHLASSVTRVLAAGFQSVLFARVASFIFRSVAAGTPLRRRLLLLLGTTLSGVTTTDHLLRLAGHSGHSLFRRSVLGPFLNVPYRLFLSALLIEAVRQALGSLCSAHICIP